MSEQDIELKLKDIISNYIEADPDEINSGMSLNSEMGIDSFSLVSLICSIENEFSVEIPDYELVKFQTLGDVVSYIKHCA